MGFSRQEYWSEFWSRLNKDKNPSFPSGRWSCDENQEIWLQTPSSPMNILSIHFATPYHELTKETRQIPKSARSSFEHVLWLWLRWWSICLTHRRLGVDPCVGKISWMKGMAIHSPVFLPGEFHGQRNLVDYSPWGCKSLPLYGLNPCFVFLTSLSHLWTFSSKGKKLLSHNNSR